MPLPLQELAHSEPSNTIVRLTENGLEFFERAPLPIVEVKTSLIPQRPLAAGEQYRFHFDMTKCIGCRSCEIACNEQNNTPPDLRWRRVGEIEGGTYPDVARHYLSMGCNHCLSAECIKGCPVDAYTKDPVTGIVLHSAEACIGCQYCVWNCPYSVPQFNPERGVVGKCDMCHGRLTDGLEPACVNACPEAAIEIEIVNMLEWRNDFALADSPGMPAAEHSLSTTRITVPPMASTRRLERVDTETFRQEHPHWSLIWMTTLIQLSAGALLAATFARWTGPVALTLLLGLTAFTLNISVLHLGRPAYAWRAMKAWRRSWLSREVLLFGLFFVSVAALAGLEWANALHPLAVLRPAILALRVMAPILGMAGIVASACIYLVPARPAWNTVHTPLGFILSALMLGAAALPVLERTGMTLHRWFSWLGITGTLRPGHLSPLPLAIAAVAWSANLAVRNWRFQHASLYEMRASAALLGSPALRDTVVATWVLAGLSVGLAYAGWPWMSLASAFTAVVASRYLFFVAVVPLNMALTFTRGSHR
jgi:DMSO reductase iron-sulfur subunit